MTRSELYGKLTIAAICTAVVLLMAAGAHAATPPVVVSVTVEGDPVPGATVKAKATVTINDGSTLQSIRWTQAGGVPVTMTGASTHTVTLVLPGRAAYRDHLAEVLEEPPAAAADLPAYIPLPEPYEAGLQDRFSVVGIAPFALEEAGAINFDIEVKTSSGTYPLEGAVHTELPWPTAIGTRNVPIKLPVLVHGKHQATYDWKLERPSGSAAVLDGAATQNPEFTPDVAGSYRLTVTDLAAGKPATIQVHAGIWEGMVTGARADGTPVSDPMCTGCHTKNTPNFDNFTPWEKSGHGHIFAQNVTNTAASAHYTQACLSCHAVGFDTRANNNGMDDQADFPALAASGKIEHGALSNWTDIVAQFPASAKLTNIQCENCHGPQSDIAHMKKDGSRMSQSSDLCGTCHGEPKRHGRYQQWQLSRHGNYETARAEGTNASCAKCHSSQGFIQWANNGFGTKPITVDWTTDDVQPITCAACHDAHAIGTTSGNDATNATVRIAGTTPMLDAGFTVNGAGRGAICMTCHNGRRGLKNDSIALTDFSRAPHVGPQTDILVGQNLYFARVGEKGNHAAIEDTCVVCHMETSDPPPTLANYSNGAYGGTNHSFYAQPDICSKCHTAITLEEVQHNVEAKLESLKASIETALKNLMQTQIRLGNAIDIGGKKTVKNAGDIHHVEFIESHGRQGVSVELADGSHVEDIALSAVKIVRPGMPAVELYSVADPILPKAGWNYFMIHSDESKGAHNPAFVNAGLDVSLFAVQTMNSQAAAAAAGRTPIAAIGGGIGDGKGAVSCTTPYVYWTEVASRTDGQAGSAWRSDVIARNLATSTASLRFVLHQTAGNLEATRTIDGGSQGAFEDVVTLFGATNAVGSLEICSDEPLLVTSRIFNQTDDGSYGQNLDAKVANLGYNTGETVSLIGLRQKTGLFRSNIFVTNGGTTPAEVAITLFNSGGQSLLSYKLTVPAGQVFQDPEPFRNRANAGDLGWGFATATVTKGTNVHVLGSMIDQKTNDPTTVHARQ